MHRVEAHQMRIRLDGPKIIDGDDLNVRAARFHNRPQNIAADPTETVDRDLDRHFVSPRTEWGRARIRPEFI